MTAQPGNVIQVTVISEEEKNRLEKRAEELISKAKTKVVLDHPEFSIFILTSKMEPDWSFPTLATDGQWIKYNPHFICQFKVKHIKTFLMHECLHIMMLHASRRRNRPHVKWNMACDYAINALLVQSKQDFGMKPGEFLYGKEFEGMSAEDIYAKIPDPPEREGGNGDGECEGQDKTGKSNAGHGHTNAGGCTCTILDPRNPDGSKMTESQIKELESQVKIAVAQSEAIAKQCGRDPLGVKRILKAIEAPVVDWRTLLANLATEIAHDDYTWTKANRRYVYSGAFLPSLENREVGHIAFVIDTSGSVSDKEVSKAAAAAEDMFNIINPSRIEVMYVDYSLHGIQNLDASDLPFKLEIKGGGGTSFRPAFEHISKNEDDEPVALVYVTDGYCRDFPKEEPDYPVIWLLIGDYDRRFTAPFGDVVRTDE